MKKLNNIEFLVDETIKERKINQLKNSVIDRQREINFLESQKQSIDLKIERINEKQRLEVRAVARLEKGL